MTRWSDRRLDMTHFWAEPAPTCCSATDRAIHSMAPRAPTRSPAAPATYWNTGAGENLLSGNSGATFAVVAGTPTPAVSIPAAAASVDLTSDGIINPFNAGYTPLQVRNGYELGLLSQPNTTLLGQGQTIAIVDPFDNPNALAT